MGRFSSCAVIVTGSSSGIGRATALHFAREGAMVTICGRDEKTLAETKSMVLKENGGDEKSILVIRGDVRDEEVMKEIVDGTVQMFGRLDVLVNNAGGTSGSIVEGNPEIEGDLSVFEYAINLNTRSVLRLCQLAYPHLIETKGEIVNVSSIAGLQNGASQPFPFYSVSKAAQDQLTRNLAVHYIRKGVRVNSVNPGLISTSIVQRSEGITDEMVRTAEKRVAAMPSFIPCGRAGTPDDVAEAILFLADRKRSEFIVGHQLVIDGGSSLQMPVICDGFKVFAEVAAEMGSKAQEHE